MASRDPTRIGLTQEQLNEAKELFDLFDKNGDGKILANEIEQLLSQLGQAPSKEQIDALLQESDLDKNGHIDFDEFLKVTAHKFINIGENTGEDPNRKAFQKFDSDGDGFITGEELKKAMGVINPNHTQEDINKILKSADIDLDGKISFDEFCSLQQ